MKGHNPQAQGMKWFARVKRAKKRDAEEARTWDETEDATTEDGTKTRLEDGKSSSSSKRARAVVDPLAVDDALVASRRREVKTKGKRRKRTSYAVDKGDLRRADDDRASKAKASFASSKQKTVDAAPKYATGNPFAALARGGGSGARS